jgi:hypothetical protein
VFAQCCVFGKQSPPPLICNQTTLRAQGSSRCWHTLSRSYGVNLPSSLTWFHSRALGFSPCPPVSVWGTDHLLQRLAAFLVSRGSSPSRPKPTASHLGVNDLAYLTTRSSYMLAPESNDRRDYLAALPHRSTTEYRNINLSSIDYAFRPRLRFRLTLGGLPFPRKPWAFGEGVSHSLYRYLCLHMLLRLLQHASRHIFVGYHNTPLPLLTKSTASVLDLSPVEFSAQKYLTSELLRFL